MRFLCFGAGAIGTYLGGKLILGGNEVVFLEREDAIHELFERGLSVDDGSALQRVFPVAAYSQITEALASGEFDFALVALKAYDTGNLIRSLEGVRADLPPIVCFQNGVENEQLFAQFLGDDRVIPGTITTAVNRVDLGMIRIERERGIGIAKHDLSGDLVQTFRAAGLNACEYENAQDMKWSKLLTNLLANASAAILGMTPGEILRDPQLFAMEMRQIREALAVMKGLDCNVIDLPGTPIRALTWLAKNVSPVISHPLLKPFLIRGRGDKLPSLYLDMAQGKTKSEVGYLNGAVARFGEALDVATPVNKMLNKILTQMLLDEQVRKQFHRNPQALLRSI